MKKTDFCENKNGFKAVNAFIFGGSFSVGVMRAGFDLNRVLEISDTQPEENAFYFIKNVEDVPVILPSMWENDEYLNNLKNENVDAMFCNCPCSSLSQINRNASVDGKNNVHFYRLFNVFKHVQPKVFVVENAPTLIKLGFPILKDFVKELGDKYRFTIVRDYAGQHNVPMKRLRTMVVGWNRDYFKSIPFINSDVQPMLTSKALLQDIYEDQTNDMPSSTSDEIHELYKYCDPGRSLMFSLALHVINDPNNSGKEIIDFLQNHPHHLKEVRRIEAKLRANKSFWDKTPLRPYENGYFASFTSVTEYLHPTQNRTLNLKELGRLMNYPDDYDFTDPTGKCKISSRQALAQGVPANFGKWIAEQVALGLAGKLKNSNDSSIDVRYQQHISNKYSEFTFDEFNQLSCLELKKSASSL